MQQRSGPATLQSKPTKFQTPRYPAEEQALRQVKPVLSRAGAASHLSGDSRYDSTNRDSSLGKYAKAKETEANKLHGEV